MRKRSFTGLIDWSLQLGPLIKAAQGDDELIAEIIGESGQGLAKLLDSGQTRDDLQGVELERVVLSAMLRDANSAAPHVASLTKDAFWTKAHQDLFQIMFSAQADGNPVGEHDIEDALSYSLEEEKVEAALKALDEVCRPEVARASDLKLKDAVAEVIDLAVRRELLTTLLNAENQMITSPEWESAALLRDTLRAVSDVGSRYGQVVGPPTRTKWKGEPPVREWLIPGLLPKGRLILFTGRGGLGKSRMALQLAAAVASGTPNWMPSADESVHPPPAIHPPREDGESDIDYAERRDRTVNRITPRPVVVWSAEDEMDEIHRRLNDLHKGKVVDVEEMGDRFHGIMAMDAGPLWAPENDPKKLGSITPHGKWVRAYCERHEAKLLVIDPLVAAYGCSENDRAQTRLFANSWGAWAVENGISILVVAHPPKNSGEDYSGNSDWQAAVRAMWTLGRMTANGKRQGSDTDGENTATKFRVPKSNYGQRQAGSHWVTMADGACRVTTFDGAVNSESDIGSSTTGNAPGLTNKEDWTF